MPAIVFVTKRFDEIFIGHKICMIYSKSEITLKATQKSIYVYVILRLLDKQASRRNSVYNKVFKSFAQKKKKTFHQDFVSILTDISHIECHGCSSLDL